MREKNYGMQINFNEKLSIFRNYFFEKNITHNLKDI
jgi:hypothetical protein